MDTQNIQGTNEARNTITGVQRPVRAQFKKMMVIGSNGTVIDQTVVDQKVTSTDKLERRRQMRANGWTQVPFFDKDAYQKAFQEYRDQNKTNAVTSRAQMINEAFEVSDQGRNSRLERALTVLLPLYAGGNDRKAIEALKKIVRTVASTATNYSEKPKAKRASKKAETAVH